MLTAVRVVGQIAKSAKVVGAQLEFVDIAGLVRGASEGAGLGNKFLGNVRQVSMILMLLRCFDDTEKDIITHVDGSVDPIRDLETIETELLLADMQTLTKRESSAGNLTIIILTIYYNYDTIISSGKERASEPERERARERARTHTHTQAKRKMSL
jgi:GTPase involved in cell partitioning and DNA repair